MLRDEIKKKKLQRALKTKQITIKKTISKINDMTYLIFF
jgi:hypothetical protein